MPFSESTRPASPRPIIPSGLRFSPSPSVQCILNQLFGRSDARRLILLGACFCGGLPRYFFFKVCCNHDDPIDINLSAYGKTAIRCKFKREAGTTRACASKFCLSLEAEKSTTALAVDESWMQEILN